MAVHTRKWVYYYAKEETNRIASAVCFIFSVCIRAQLLMITSCINSHFSLQNIIITLHPYSYRYFTYVTVVTIRMLSLFVSEAKTD